MQAATVGVGTATTPDARGARRGPWWPVVLAGTGSTAVAGALLLLGRAAEAGYPASSPAEGTSFAVAFSLAGAVLMRLRAASAVGRLLLVCGLLAEAGVVGAAIGAAWWLVRGGDAPAFEDLAGVLSLTAVSLLVALLPQVFPEGLLPGRPWRVLAAATTATGLVLVLALVPSARAGEAANVLVYGLWSGWAVLAVLVGLASLAVRWRRSDRLHRHQLVPAAVFGLVPLVALLVLTLAPEPVTSRLPDSVLVPVWVVATIVALALAVARHRLFGIEVRPRRLALFVAGVVALAVVFASVCSALLWSVTVVDAGSTVGWGVAALGATTAIVLAAVAAGWAVRALRRHLLGDREAAWPLLATFGAAPADDMAADLAAVFAAALGAPGVRLTTAPAADDRAADDDRPDGAAVVPLLLHGERLGELTVDPRTPGEPYSPADQQLVAVLAHQVAVHLYLQRREEEALAARRDRVDELLAERARVGRDLHDGLGPLLAGASLSAEALRRGMAPGSRDERDAGRLADRLRTAAGETRRIAHALQPAALDDGLEAAVERYLADLPGPAFAVAIDVPALPADVSTAAYLVVLEGVSNVLRHARAQHVRVSMAVNDTTLVLTITDDGVGLPTPYVSGLGIRSMRERAAGLGGTVAVAPGPGGGTVLTAGIPLR